MRNPITTMLIGLLACLGLVLTACSSGPTAITAAGDHEPPVAIPGPDVVLASNALVPFDRCDAFLDHVISHAVELVGPYGLHDGFGLPRRLDEMALAADGAGEATQPGGAPQSSFSGTNVQVEGVDEPDIVKTDGERIVLLSEGRLIVVDVTGAEPVEVGRLRLDDMAVHRLFLSGDTVLMFGSVWSSRPLPLAESDAAIAPVPHSPVLQIIEVDISERPELVRTMTVDGAFVSGRMTGDTVRLVSTSGPVGFEWSYPEGSGLRAEREAIENNREIVRESTAENWIPYYIVTDADGRVVEEGTLFDCNRARHPDEFSGVGMLSVTTIDMSQGLAPLDATGVLASGDTVYASTDSLYVATQSWRLREWARTGSTGDRSEEVSTDIHKFDVSSTTTEYVASGEVRGYLLDQFAMDEHEGLLRVASTTAPNRWGSGADSESMVTVLAEIGGDLVGVGLVEGLGESERIYSVRFMGEEAYVVTFRQTDPLYTIDLSNPSLPVMTGELKILGYSAYLHPVGESLLMGVGQDASEEGRVRGTQVSVFDVGDPAAPERVASYELSEGTNSEVEYDHHAFLYWEPEGLSVIPVQQWRWDDKGEEAFFGAVVLKVGPDGALDEVARITHPGGDDAEWDWGARIQRSVVIGDGLYTISPKGMLKSDLGTLEDEAWLGF